MPEMISLRKFRLASTSGHVVVFEANQPRFVPESVVSEAMAAGCVPTEAAAIPFYEDMTRAKVEFAGDARRSTIYLAVKAIAEGNRITEFDSGGTPKHEAVAERLGYTVNRDEVRSIFQQYKQVMAEGREFVLHPQAMNIMKVIDAGSKAELLELGGEFGVEGKQCNGLTVRELRKLLLTKLSGMVVTQ